MRTPRARTEGARPKENAGCWVASCIFLIPIKFINRGRFLGDKHDRKVVDENIFGRVFNGGFSFSVEQAVAAVIKDVIHNTISFISR